MERKNSNNIDFKILYIKWKKIIDLMVDMKNMDNSIKQVLLKLANTNRIFQIQLFLKISTTKIV